MTDDASGTDPGGAGASPQPGPVPDPAPVPRLEADETVAPRPEEEIADAVRGTDSTPPAP